MLKKDIKKISDLDFKSVKQLVTYYQISDTSMKKKINSKLLITFDKDKIHELFYKNKISYSDISDKELYIFQY